MSNQRFGSEFKDEAESGTPVPALCREHGIRLEFTQPGKPQQNACVERYNHTVRYSWLNQYLFDSIKAVQDYATDWLWFYNHERRNKANGGLPPKRMLNAA